MLSSVCFLWDICYPLCTYSSIFIIFLIAWQIRQSYQGLRLEPKKNCCQHHRKVRQRARDAASRARRLSKEEAEKPWELLSIMKSQSWLPGEENVQQFLCVDPCCQICDAATLEIQQLLESEKSQLSPALLGLPRRSSCLEMLPISSVSFEQNMKLYSGHSRQLPLASGTEPVTQLTEHLTNAGGGQQCWADHHQLGQEFHLADMPMVSESVASSRLKGPVVLVIEEKIMQSKTKPDQEGQDHHHLRSAVSLLSLNPKITNLTHAMSLHMGSALSSHLPLFSPKVRRLLELHVKKWIHFQKWGLPRRVEESMRQLLPDPTLFCQSRKNPLSSILNSSSKVTLDKIGTISHQINSFYLAGLPIQTCWVSEWSVINWKQRNHWWHQIHTYLPSHELECLNDCSPLPKAQANDSRSNLQSKYYSQLFCGLPSLHSESLDVTSLSSQGVSKNESTPKSPTDPRPSRELSLPFLPKVPHKSALPSSPTSPEGKTPCEHEGLPQITVPFLTLEECEALECHLLDRQVRLQWGPPAVFLKSWYTQSHVQCELHGKARTVKTSWPGKSSSHPTREFFLPEHARRLLEFHLQKQLIYLRWGLPQRIQRSIHLLLSSTDQLSCRSIPGDPKADGSGDRLSPRMGKGSIHMPHLFVQAKAMLKSHVDAKCGQIHEGKVPGRAWSSREGDIPGTLAAMAPFSWISQGQCPKLQAENIPDLHQKVVPWKAKSNNQERQALSGALIEHCKRPQALPQETIKKLETTLQHKYLAFLSGLPTVYCMALSRPTSPAVTIQPRGTKMMSRPVKSPPKAQTQTTSLEGSLEPCTQDSEASANTAEELQPEVQVEGRTEKIPLESQPALESPCSLNTEILERLNFHLKKKILGMQFGISEKEEYKELAVTGLKSGYMQEFLGSLSIPESTVLQEQPTSCDSPPAPDVNRAHLKKQPAAACQEQRQPSSKAVPHGSAAEGSTASQVCRNMIKAQVQMGTSGEETSPEEPFSPEPQRPVKSKYSSHAPTVTEKREEPGKPKAVGDLGKGDTGLGLSPASEKAQQDGHAEPELQHRTAQGCSQQGQSLRLEDIHLSSPQQPPELEFPDPPPEVLMEAESEHNMQGSQMEASAIPEPARMAGHPQPVFSQAFQDRPFHRPLIQGKRFQGQTWQGHGSPGRMMPASAYVGPSLLPEASLKNKMKSFLQSISPKIRGKTHTEPSMVSRPGKVAKTKENVEKALPQAKSPSKKTKTEDSRGPKGQSGSSEKSVIASFLTAPHILDSKLWPHSRRLGQPHHCPRHCPKLAYATQHRNPP
ncbi:protein SPATA31F1 [Meriones unguiculatus]|uniref:protein SPATA31F1 n=1 Tax=Meriones unguiculatus TaxID=10047 RepID=UPI00293EC9F6|nr:protein SPATA31F1 [Meriones unguiculatus]